MPRVAPPQAELGIYTWGKNVKRDYSPIAHYIIDVAGLRDPQSNRGFNKKYSDGRPGEVQLFVKEDDRYNAISDTIKMLAFMHLKSEAKDDKWLSIALVDYHGKWVAPAVAELVSDELSNAGYRVATFHYDIIEGSQK